MEAIWNTVSDMFKCHQVAEAEEQRLESLCRRIAGFDGEISGLFNSEEPYSISVLYDHYDDDDICGTSVSIIFQKDNGFVVDEVLCLIDQKLEEDPQKKQEATARCEQVNAELMGK